MMMVLTLQELNSLTRTSIHDTGSHDIIRSSLDDRTALWTQVLATAHDPNISSKHLTAACNALCYLARANLNDSRDEVKRLAYSYEAWQQLLSVSSIAFMHGKNKPALQILETIVLLATQQPSRVGLAQDTEILMQNMVKLLIDGDLYSRYKEASIVILLFLRKLSHLFSFADVLMRVYGGDMDSSTGDSLQASQAISNAKSEALCSFIVSLLTAINVAESKSAPAKLLEYIVTNHRLFPGVDVARATNLAIRHISMNHALQGPQTLTDALPAIVTSREDFYAILHTNLEDGSSVEAISVALVIMLYGRMKHYLSHEDTVEYTQRLCSKRPNLEAHWDEDYGGYTSLLNSCEPALRLQALRLLTFCTSPKEVMPPKLLQVLSATCPTLHDDTDAFQRGELVSIFRNILTRLQQSYIVLSRSTQHDHKDSFMKTYGTFGSSYYQFLIAELTPSVSYSRHILALQMLCLVFDYDECSHTNEASLFVQDTAMFDSLTLMLHDPFDDVRSLSTRLLRTLVRVETPLFRELWTDGNILEKTSALATRTNRADHADALGRAMMIDAHVDQRQAIGKSESIGVAEVSFRARELSRLVTGLEALKTNSPWPLHGMILGLAYTLSETSACESAVQADAILKSVLSISAKIWSLTQPHLCVDSPETELEEADEAMHTGPKDQLAYAWRALRDTNVLMQSLLKSTSIFSGAIAPIGEMCFEQLARLRHRGAFSTVAQTFLLCCEKARHNHLQEVLDHWFRRALQELELQADKLTRRSAGLPAMFTAIVDPYDNEKFTEVINHLLITASKAVPESDKKGSEVKLRLPQVHALNCLKDIMTNSRLRARTESIVLRMIGVACHKMTSTVWAVKNCGLMLLRACITRLEIRTVATGPARTESSRPKDGLETPIATALALLYSDDHEAVFAGLDILGRLSKDHGESEAVTKPMIDCLGHRIWHIRAQAARLLAIQIEPTKVIPTMTHLFAKMPAQSKQNYLHGCMLVLRNILPTLAQRNKGQATARHDLGRILSGLLQNVDIMTQGILCSVWLEVTLYATREGVITLSDFTTLMAHFQALPDKSARADYALCVSYQALAFTLDWACSPNSESILHDVVDDRAAEFVLTKLRDFVAPSYAPRIATFAVRCVGADFDEHARCAAVRLLTLCLKLSDQVACGLVIEQMSTTVLFDGSASRALFGAQLVIFMKICVISYQKREPSMIALMRHQAQSFVARLQSASSDEVDMDCRLAALESLEQLKETPSPVGVIDSLFQDSDKISILCILYDLLNDDNEEIRNRASDVVRCFRTSPAVQEVALACCPIVSRHLLVDYILAQPSGEDTLHSQAVGRLLGVKAEAINPVARIIAFCEENSVRDIMDSIRVGMDDLFAEEKQNLYIDDMAEIRLWARIAVATERPGRDRLLTSLERWIRDGLQHISDLLIGSRLNSTTHSNGWIFEPQAELSIVRAIVLGRVLAAGAVVQNQIRIQLELIRQECTQSSIVTMISKSFSWPLR